MQPTISVYRGDDYVVQTPATDSLCSVRWLHWIRWRRFLVGFHGAESTASCTLVTKDLKYIRINETFANWRLKEYYANLESKLRFQPRIQCQYSVYCFLKSIFWTACHTFHPFYWNFWLNTNWSRHKMNTTISLQSMYTVKKLKQFPHY